MSMRRALFGLSLCGVFASLAVVPTKAVVAQTAKDGGVDAGKMDAALSKADASTAPAALEAGSKVEHVSSDAGVQSTIEASTPKTHVPTFTRRAAPPLPPPTPEQLAAYEALKGQADQYERVARDYKDTVTAFITLHYEEKKKAILAGLDREIGVEKAELKKARDTAIRRLEEFVAKYSGTNAKPEATPDAMYRLAALYEERARTSEDPNDDLAMTLKPAIALYKRVIKEFPNYKELAGIYYFLGHALNDSRRIPEAQQVWRSLVCRNKYPYPTTPDPKDPDADTVGALPQDNTEEYWKRWRAMYPTPQSLKKAGADAKFEDPFPAECKAIAQPSIRNGEEPKYLAEVWWQIGNWEFDQLDLGGGVIEYEPFAVWDFNRAASAYQHSLDFKKPPLFGVALYKYAWTLFKQQRYEAAVREFVRLLVYTDEQQKLTGDPGADFRAEAYTYIAGSLVNVDFVGPEAGDPYITREDIVTTETRPGVAEQKLRVAIERVQDPKIVPQDKPWTIEIYKALGSEYRALNHYTSAIAVYEKILEKWPMDPGPARPGEISGAPDTQNNIAEVYELLARSTRVGSERSLFEGKVLEARTALAKYIGNTPWVDANKENPGALQRAEELVKGGLKGAAIQHTRNGQAAIDEAEATSDPKAQLQALVRAREEYRLAALGWLGYIKQDENAPDAYRSRYFYADALHQQVRIQVLLHKVNSTQFPEPANEEIETGKNAAIDVRDSDEDDQFLANAAFIVVDLSDVGRDLAFQKHKETSGTQGVLEKTEPQLEGPDGAKKVVRETVPPVVLASMRARDEFVQRVSPAADKKGRAATYLFYVAQQLFAYGNFQEARDRFEPLWKEHCGKDEIGYESWKHLLRMATLENDAERSRQLAEAEKSNSCAKTDLQKAEASRGDLTDKVLQNAAFQDANKVFEDAKAAPEGPEKEKLWRKAAGLYEAALRAAPGHKDAPAAAINSAFCYKQVGEFAKAIELYNLFISNYGSEENLNRLQRGGTDPETKSKVGPDPEQYKERIKYLGMAYDALSTTYYGFFAYQRAAESFAKIATNDRFDDDRRQNAARIAMTLYANLGDRQNMMTQYRVLTGAKMKLAPERKAEADFRIVDFEYSQWNPNGSDTGSNRTARLAAEAAMNGYYNANQKNGAAARFSVEAAYKKAKMARASGDAGYRNWLKSTIAAWEFFRSHPYEVSGGDGKKITIRAEGAPYNDYAAEAEFILADEVIRSEFDYATGHHKFSGTVVEVTKKYDDAFEQAEKKYRPLLDKIATQYQSFEWTPAAIARAGSLYDSLRTGLEYVVPKYFTPQQEALLEKLRNLGQDQKADEIEDAVRAKWREAKDQRLDQSNQRMINRYVQAALFARKYNVKNSAVQAAVARLAFFTDFLGDEKMRKYVEQTPDPMDPEPDPAKKRKVSYTSKMFLQWRAGLVSHPPPTGDPAPLPVAP